MAKAQRNRKRKTFRRRRIFGFFILLTACAFIVYGKHSRTVEKNLPAFAKKGKEISPAQPVQRQARKTKAKENKFYKKTERPRPAPEKKSKRKTQGNRTVPAGQLKGRIALVIDDAGYDLSTVTKLLKMNKPLTLAVLPHLPYSKQCATQAKHTGAQVILHLPMEPGEKSVNPGPGVILTSMRQEEVIKTLKTDLEAVPYIVGVNNHMGSRATADEKTMRTVLSVVKQKGYFFLDSLTGPDSLGEKIARELGVKTGKRQVFLDGQKNEAYINGQLFKLADIAAREGTAIGIGHVHPVTVRTLLATVPLLEKQGITFVYLSEALN